MSRRLPWRPVAAAVLALAGTAGAWGQASVPCTVRPGDTLWRLSAEHLQGASDWAAVARLNGLRPPYRLQPGQLLKLPADRLRGVPAAATVAGVHGEARWAAGDAALQPLAVGALLPEGARLAVAAGAVVTLRLPDGSQLQLQGPADVALHELRAAQAWQVHATRIRLERGRVDATVAPQRAGSRFDVRTPLAVAGVRGTRFGVALSEDGARFAADVTEGAVAVAGGADALRLAPGEGAVRAAGGALQSRPLPPAPRLDVPDEPWGVWPQPLPLAADGPGASRYLVQLAEDEGFGRIVFSDTAARAPVQLRDLPDGALWLRVRAVDADGLAGAPAVVPLRVKTQPVPPLQQSPAPGAPVAVGEALLRCTGVPGASGYRLQLSPRADFKAVEQAAQAAGRCEFRVPLPVPGRRWWRVATVRPAPGGAEDQGPWSHPAEFEVVERPPAPAAPGSEDGAPGALHWQGRAGERFELQLARDPGFAELLQTVQVDEPRARLALPAGCRPLYVRLRTLAAPGGVDSPFSPPRELEPTAGVCTGDGEPVRLLDGGALGGSSR